MNIYLVADVQSVIANASKLPDHVATRAMGEADVQALAAVYRLAYGTDVVTLEAAVGEMESAFDGTWGPLLREASLVARVDDETVAGVQTVRRPSWEDRLDRRLHDFSEVHHSEGLEAGRDAR